MKDKANFDAAFVNAITQPSAENWKAAAETGKRLSDVLIRAINDYSTARCVHGSNSNQAVAARTALYRLAEG